MDFVGIAAQRQAPEAATTVDEEREARTAGGYQALRRRRPELVIGMGEGKPPEGMPDEVEALSRLLTPRQFPREGC